MEALGLHGPEMIHHPKDVMERLASGLGEHDVNQAAVLDNDFDAFSSFEPVNPSPPDPEPARVVPQRVVGVEDDPIHTVIRAGQQSPYRSLKSSAIYRP